MHGLYAPLGVHIHGGWDQGGYGVVCNVQYFVWGCIVIFILFCFFFHTSTSQLLDKPWSQVSSRLAPGSCLRFLLRIGFSAIPLLVDISSSVAYSRSRAFRKSICAQEEVPANLYEYALGGARTHETDLYQARG